MTKEERKAYDKAYREANKAKRAAQAKAYYEANKTVMAQRSKAFYEANREKQKAAGRAHWQKISENLGDTFVLSCLHMKAAPPELIELKREQLLAHRMTKQLTNLLKEQNHGTE